MPVWIASDEYQLDETDMDNVIFPRLGKLPRNTLVSIGDIFGA